jgi:hypothetical protein
VGDHQSTNFDGPHGFGYDSDSKDSTGCNHTINIDVKLAFSGLPVAHLKMQLSDTVGDLLRIISKARTWPPGTQQLCLGKQILETGMSLETAGVCDRSVLEVVCTSLRWNSKVKGSHAEISEDGLIVCRRDKQFKFNHAIAMTNGATRNLRFEVLDNSARFAGGVEIGFSSVAPDTLDDGLPPSAVGLRHAWICDCHGALHAYTGSFHALDIDFDEQGWDPESLRSGDIVECCVCNAGRLHIQVNDHEVANWDASVPDGLELYPVVSVFGKTTAIKLLRAQV